MKISARLTPEQVEIEFKGNGFKSVTRDAVNLKRLKGHNIEVWVKIVFKTGEDNISEYFGEYSPEVLDLAYKRVDEIRKQRAKKMLERKLAREKLRRNKAKEIQLKPEELELKRMFYSSLAEVRNKRKFKVIMGKDSLSYPDLCRQEKAFKEELKSIIGKSGIKINIEKLIKGELKKWE